MPCTTVLIIDDWSPGNDDGDDDGDDCSDGDKDDGGMFMTKVIMI